MALVPRRDAGRGHRATHSEIAERADPVGFAGSGQVTEDGRAGLLGALDDAKASFDQGDAEATVAALEEFKRLASDPELVTTTAARDKLIAGADTLIAAVQGTG